MRRLVLLSFVALCLAACGKDDSRAFLDSRTPPSLGPQFWAPEGWAWGTLEIKGAPEVRYGVSGPARGPTGRVMVIATGYGESAEVYFETARDLNARGWTVWVIEPHGQGGSGRFSGGRDTGRSAGFDKDAKAIRTLVEQVIRPSQADTMVLAAHGSGALVALMALEGGLNRVDRLFVWDPDFTASRQAGDATNFTRIGLGFLRAEGGGWKRPEGNITRRATLPLAWPVANPDLRMGGPGWSWLAAEAAAVSTALGPVVLKGIEVPTDIRGRANDRDAARVCRDLLLCNWFSAPANEHLASEEVREAWISWLAPAPPPPPAPPAPIDHSE